MNQLGNSLGLADHITMLGQVTRSKVECRFDTAWVQVVPSRWAEPFGLVAAEAMMRGTVVVASKIGGLTEIVQDGKTGFLVAPGDVTALTTALLKLLTDCELAERMGKRGHEVALAQLSEATYVDRFVTLYQMLAHKDKEMTNE